MPAVASAPTYRMFSVVQWLPLVSIPIFFIGLYPYLRELMDKFVFPDILEKDNETAVLTLAILTAFSTMTSNTAQLADIIKPTSETSLDSRLKKSLKLAARVIVSIPPAIAAGQLTRYQVEEFNFDITKTALISCMLLLASVEFMTTIQGTHPSDLVKLWKAFAPKPKKEGLSEITALINDDSDHETPDFSRLFPSRNVTLSLTAVYVPLAMYALYSLINEFYRNIKPSSGGEYTLFIVCTLASTFATIFDLDRWSKLLQEFVKFKPSVFSILTAMLVVVNSLLSSLMDAVRGFEVHDVGYHYKMLGYISITAVLLAKFTTSVTLTQDFGNYVSEKGSQIKAACLKPPLRRHASTVAPE